MSKKSTGYGLLVDYHWCTGCHSCEIACQMEHDFPTGQYGIKLNEIGPWEYAEDTWQLTYLPFPTDQCDMCISRTSIGKLPSCVHHCQAKCLTYGPLEDLSNLAIKNPNQALFTK